MKPDTTAAGIKLAATKAVCSIGTVPACTYPECQCGDVYRDRIEDRVDAAFSALPVTLDQMADIAAGRARVDEGWLPIAGAPKDGKPIIVGWPEYVSETAMWDIGSGQWVRAVWQQGEHENTPSPFDETPTHWMPLPSPPKVSP